MALDAATAAIPARVPAPPAPLGLWRAFRAARRNVLEIVPQTAYREPVIGGGTRAPWLMVQDPPWVEHVLKTRARDYPRSDITRRLLKPTEGQSLFTADWDEWRWQHRAMTPIFNHRNLAALGGAMTASAEATAGRLAAQAGEAPVDVYPEMVAATFDVINDTAFQAGGERLDRDRVSRGITRFIETVARISLLDILGAPDWIPRPARLFTRGGRDLDAVIDGVVAGRTAARSRGETPGAPDLLDFLIDAADPQDGRRMTAVEVRNNLTAFIVAGHETTALALTWALYLLAFDPAAQARARAEAQGLLGDRAATAADLPALPYVRAVIDEALRLYPPAGFMARTAQAEDEIAGRPVRRGTTVMLPVYAMHRHDLLWRDPDAFDPERFAHGEGDRRRFDYLPFGAGPRICIGRNFALMEAAIILATLAARFGVALPPGFTPRPRMIVTLRPEGGMPLLVTRL